MLRISVLSATIAARVPGCDSSRVSVTGVRVASTTSTPRPCALSAILRRSAAINATLFGVSSSAGLRRMATLMSLNPSNSISTSGCSARSDAVRRDTPCATRSPGRPSLATVISWVA